MYHGSQLQELMDYTVLRSHPALLLLIALLIADTGCSGHGNNVWVTGKLLKEGKKYVSPTGQHVHVTFVSLETKGESGTAMPSGEPYWTDVDQTIAAFSIPGLDGQRIPQASIVTR
jgi:hypothetical protein